MKTKRFVGSMLGLTVALSLTACGSKQSIPAEGSGGGKAAVKEVHIGVLYPESGSNAELGTAALHAVQLAAEDINAKGGIKSLGGAKFVLDIVDPGSDEASTKTATENILKNPNIVALTGDYVSTQSLVTASLAEKAKIPFVTASISDKLTGSGYKYLFQVSPKGSMFGQTEMEFVSKLLPNQKPKVAIVYEDTAYGSSTSDGLKKTAQQLGYEVVLYESYHHGFTDAAPLINKIKESGAQVMFPVGYLQDSILIEKTKKQLGVKCLTIGGGSGYLMAQFQQALGDAANGVISVASWNNDLNKPGVSDVAKRYKEKYGSFITEHSGEAYSATWVIADAIEKAASTDPDKIRDAMASLTIKDGEPGGIMPGGDIQFDSTGWNKNVYPVMIQWQDGAPRTIYPDKDATVKIIK